MRVIEIFICNHFSNFAFFLIYYRIFYLYNFIHIFEFFHYSHSIRTLKKLISVGRSTEY